MSQTPVPEGSQLAEPRPSPSPRPRVWPVFVTYAAVLVSLFILGAIFVAVGVVSQLGPRASAAEFARAAQAFAESPGGLLAGTLMTSLTLFGVAFVAGIAAPEAFGRRLRLGSTELPWRHTLLMFAGVLAVGQIMDSVVALMGWGGKGSLAALARGVAHASGLTLFAALLIIGVFGPIAEELFFRGFMETRLVQRFGGWPGILTTALLFGLIHLDLLHTPLAMVIGICLGWAAEASGTIRVAALLHVGNNTLWVLLASSIPGPILAWANLVLLVLSVGVAVPTVWWLRAHYEPLAGTSRRRRGPPNGRDLRLAGAS